MRALARFLDSKTPRERMLLAASGALALVWLATTQVWQPLLALRLDLAASIPRIDRALVRLQDNPAMPGEQAADPRAIPVVITEAADTFGLLISRLQPQGGQVLLTLEDAPFETVLLWIEALQRDDGLRLVELSLTRRLAPGIVGVTLALER